MLLGIIVSSIVAGATLMFVRAVHKQIKQENRIFKRQTDVLIKNNKLETFVQIEQYKKEVFAKYNIIDDLVKGHIIKKEHSQTYRNVEDLMTELDILGMKYYELELDLKIIYSIVGNTIIAIYRNETICDIIEDAKTKNKYAYDNFTKIANELIKFN